MCRSERCFKWETILITRAIYTRPRSVVRCRRQRGERERVHTWVIRQHIHSMPNIVWMFTQPHRPTCRCAPPCGRNRIHIIFILSFWMPWAWIFTANISRILSAFEKRKLPSRDLLCRRSLEMWLAPPPASILPSDMDTATHIVHHNTQYMYVHADAVKINLIHIHVIFHRRNFWWRRIDVVVGGVVNFSVIYERA